MVESSAEGWHAGRHRDGGQHGGHRWCRWRGWAAILGKGVLSIRWHESAKHVAAQQCREERCKGRKLRHANGPRSLDGTAQQLDDVISSHSQLSLPGAKEPVRKAGPSIADGSGEVTRRPHRMGEEAYVDEESTHATVARGADGG